MFSRAASLAARRTALARSAHTMSKDAYTKSPESFDAVLATFKKYRACAVLRTPKAEQAPPAMQAAIDGGFEIVEFTLTTPGCLDAVSDFRSRYDGKVMVGCGTVMDIPDAKAAMDAGSEFPVAPMLTLNPTSGVDLDNAGDFLKNGASSVGLVAPLFPPDAVLNSKWDVIHANAVKVIGNVKAVA